MMLPAGGGIFTIIFLVWIGVKGSMIVWYTYTYWINVYEYYMYTYSRCTHTYIVFFVNLCRCIFSINTLSGEGLSNFTYSLKMSATYW